MDASGISATGTLNAATSQRDLSGINGGDFMQILITELQHQDPFEPMSNQEMVGQMSTIRELEMNTRLSDSLAQVTDQQRFGTAAALIGKFVEGAVSDAEGNIFPTAGIVSGIRFNSSGDAMLELSSGEVMPMNALQRVASVDDMI